MNARRRRRCPSPRFWHDRKSGAVAVAEYCWSSRVSTGIDGLVVAQRSQAAKGMDELEKNHNSHSPSSSTWMLYRHISHTPSLVRVSSRHRHDLRISWQPHCRSPRAVSARETMLRSAAAAVELGVAGDDVLVVLLDRRRGREMSSVRVGALEGLRCGEGICTMDTMPENFIFGGRNWLARVLVLS